MKSLSDKRLIINGKVNGKEYPFLIDTGASVALIDENCKKKLGLKTGRRANTTIMGAGGTIENTYMCDTPVEVNGKQISQFIFSDLSNIQESIRRETGKTIVGIISLPQMKFLGMTLDPLANEIKFK